MILEKTSTSTTETVKIRSEKLSNFRIRLAKMEKNQMILCRFIVRSSLPCIYFNQLRILKVSMHQKRTEQTVLFYSCTQFTISL